jgi:hypothetical protein
MPAGRHLVIAGDGSQNRAKVQPMAERLKAARPSPCR